MTYLTRDKIQVGAKIILNGHIATITKGIYLNLSGVELFEYQFDNSTCAIYADVVRAISTQQYTMAEEMIPLTRDRIKVGVKVRRKTDTEIGIVYEEEHLPLRGSHHIFGIRWSDGSKSAHIAANASTYFYIVEEGISYDEVRSNVRQEKPCQVCRRKNDLGVKVCWSCGNHP